MRSLILSSLLLLALVIQGSVTVTIGTGTNITSGYTPDISPYKTYFKDGQDQILYTAAELIGEGLGAGNILALAFNVASADPGTLNSFTIEVQQTSATSLSGFLTSGWTTCYSTNVVAVTGWNIYTFTSPFNWDGSSSLVFKVCFDNSDYTANSQVYYTSSPSSGVHFYFYDDLPSGSGCDELIADGNVARPNVRITGQPGSSPILSVSETSLDFGSVFAGNTSAELSYSISGYSLSPASGNVTITPPAGFRVATATGGPYSASPINVPYSGGTLASTPVYVVFMPNIAGTMYTGNVTNSGGGATPMNVAVTGYCPCSSASIPYCQNFTESSFPTCWTQTFSGGLPSDRWSISNTATAGGTAYESKCSWIDAYGTSRLISPTLNTSGLSSVHMSFRQMYDDFNAGFNDVNIMVQSRFDGGSWTTEWSHAGGIGSSIPAEVRELDILVTGTVLELAWTVDGYHYDFNYWYVDEICVSTPLLHDVLTVSIDDIPAIITPGTTIAPKATVKNTGTTSPETFNVTMTITGGYSSTVTGVSLNSGAQTQVTFADWTPPQDKYTVQACTQLAGDLNSTNDCKSKPVTVKPPEKMYCYVAYAGTSALPIGPAYFWDNDPGNITSLAASTSVKSILAGTWANGTWYGSEYWDASPATGGGWWTINPVTGAMTKLADLGRSFTGIAYDLTAKIMYGIDWTGTTNNLYTIVPATGASTLIGTIGTGELLINLATDGAAISIP